MQGQNPFQGGFGNTASASSGFLFGSSSPESAQMVPNGPQAVPFSRPFGHAPAAGGFGQTHSAGGFGQTSVPGRSSHALFPGPFGQLPASGGFGQPSGEGGFGNQTPFTRTFGQTPVAAGFTFGAPDVNPQPPKSFDFGSGRRTQASRALPPGPARQQQQAAQIDEEEDAFDYESAKRDALKSMPTFAGGAARSAPALQKAAPVRPPPPPPPPPRSGKGNILGDPAEAKRRAERTSRFSDKSSSQIHLPQPPVLSRPHYSGSNDALVVDGGGGDVNGSELVDDDVGERGAIVGTCEEMCPSSERDRRQNMSDIQVFERVDPANASLTSPELAVKRFARTVDDPHASEFRTRGALTRTMEHLRRLLDRTDVRFGLVHKFLWDRYRSVRQDLYIQGITDGFAIAIFEEIVRFHVLCEHELCGEDQSSKLCLPAL